MRNHYEVLGVEKSASQDEISKAYKKLAKKFHPDSNKEPGAVDKFKEVSEAYTVLGDAQKRANYDNPQPQMGGFGFDPFAAFFNQMNRPSYDVDINLSINISFKECFYGCKKSITLPKKEKCPNCQDGIKSSSTCTECSGTGKKTSQARNNWFVEQHCGACRGTGKKDVVRCECGTGYKTVGEETFEIQLPIGIVNGSVLRVHGKGHRIEGYQGNLNVQVNVETHQNITRINNDLIYRVWCPAHKMLFGGIIDLVLFDNKYDMTIAEKTQSGTKVRLKGQGIQGGDLFIIVNIDVNSLEQYLQPLTEEKTIIDFSN